MLPPVVPAMIVACSCVWPWAGTFTDAIDGRLGWAASALWLLVLTLILSVSR